MRKLILVLLFVFTAPCYAWNAMGHSVIAKIAYDRLDPNVKTKIDKLAATFAMEYPTVLNFTQMAPWPDSLHAQKIEAFTHWHYIGNGFSGDGTPVTLKPDTDNAVWAVNQIEPVVGNANANNFERARFLAFLIHIVGDLHQPLHAMSRITAAHPNGDNGGNLYAVMMQGKGRNGLTNLHAVWDDGLGMLMGDYNDAAVAALAKNISAKYSESYFSNDKIADQNPADWAMEDGQLVTSIVYTAPENQMLNQQYITSGQEVVKQRVALAGYRLAYLLNHLLG